PNNEPVQLGGQWHHEWINDNPDIRERYGLNEATSGEQNRVDALKKGFARINYRQNGGRPTVEAPAQDWRAPPPAGETFLRGNADQLAHMTVNLTDANGNAQDTDSVRLMDYPNVEKMDRIPFQPGEDVRALSPKKKAPPEPDLFGEVPADIPIERGR